VDWTGFDLVGLNYYRTSFNDADYAKNLRDFQRHGKPIVIVEFGCCAFEGAAEMGPAGGTIVDWTANPPEIAGPYRRDDQVQADYLSQQLDVFEAKGVHGAYVFEFIEPPAHGPRTRAMTSTCPASAWSRPWETAGNQRRRSTNCVGATGPTERRPALVPTMSRQTGPSATTRCGSARARRRWRRARG
jgi:hypothetical protein